VCAPVANIKSQIKRIGTNEKRRLRNKAAKSEVKTRVKTAVYAAGAGEETAAEDLRLAVRRLDKAAARGIIHPNQAANRKSALMRRVAELAVVSGAGSSASPEPGDSEEPEE
jgi:small subunit ribosomal protein S20